MALDFPGSPATGTTYTGPGGVIWVYDGAKWVSGTLTTGIYAPITNDNGRNLIHNSMMNVAQRGTGVITVTPAATSVFTADRWAGTYGASGDALTAQVQAQSDTGRLQIGDEAAANFISCVFTGGSGASNYVQFYQAIEGVRRLAGKTVTVSFWANATVAKLGVNLLQDFGSGGSPSAAVWIPTGQSVTLTTTFTRYSLTFTLPVISSVKTVGTNGNDSTRLAFWFSSGSGTNALAGNIGQQTGTVNLWGVQLEIGTVATPLEKLDPVTQLQQCQRFYCTRAGHDIGGVTANTITNYIPYAFPVTMRAAPQVVYTLTGGSGYNPPTTGLVSVDGFHAAVVGTATAYIALATFTASADL